MVAVEDANLVNGYTGTVYFTRADMPAANRERIEIEKDQQGWLKELSEESANPRTPKPINKHSCC